jgi:hypothetical protein
MLIYYLADHAAHGKLTLRVAAKDFLVCEVGGILFGVLLTGVLSLVGRKNLFRGFPEQRGGR